ncbi:MAG: restriction endonuclease subunit S [Acidaminococcaceae bacterium]|nr:restriction endonuclease subunit S [Acidaminococcaceae bacterium]
MDKQIRERIKLIQQGQIPVGYKKSEFGIFPCDWITNKRLSDVGSFGKGKGIPGEKLVNYGVPCVGYGDIYMKYNNFHFNKAESHVDEITASESQPISKGTLLFTGTGETADEIGKCVCYNGEEIIYAGGDIITFEAQNINPLFLAYQQYQPFSLKKKASFGQGHSVVHIQTENLKMLNIAYPNSKEEQARIVNVLKKWDKANILLEKIIENYRNKRRYLLKEVFEEKKESTKIRIGDFIQEQSERNKTGITNIKSVSNKRGFIDQRNQFSKIVASADVSNYKVVKKHNIAYNPSRINVGSIAIYEDDEPGVVSPMYIVFSCIGISPKFLLLLLETDRGKYEIESLLLGSVRNTLSYSDLCEVQLFLPHLDESIVLKTFSLIETTIQMYENYLKRVKAQRSTLQRYLLNGIVRV